MVLYEIKRNPLLGGRADQCGDAVDSYVIEAA
jgi:hypothetical protein